MLWSIHMDILSYKVITASNKTSKNNAETRKILKKLMIILHFFVGIGAMAGGAAALLNPEAPMGLNAAETLQNSPFNNFLIPGLLLFGVIGVGNLFAGFMLLKKNKFEYYISGILGGGLMVWIVVQCIMIRAVVALHVIYFLIGVIQAGLCAWTLFKKNLFPFNII